MYVGTTTRSSEGDREHHALIAGQQEQNRIYTDIRWYHNFSIHIIQQKEADNRDSRGRVCSWSLYWVMQSGCILRPCCCIWSVFRVKYNDNPPSMQTDWNSAIPFTCINNFLCGFQFFSLICQEFWAEHPRITLNADNGVIPHADPWQCKLHICGRNQRVSLRFLSRTYTDYCTVCEHTLILQI